MGSQLDQIRQAAMALSEDERVVLIELLAASLTPDNVLLSEAWLREIKRRSDDIDAGRVELTSWEIVRARVHTQVFGNDEKF